MSKKVSDSINGTPGTSLSMADMVDKPGEKKEEGSSGKLSNQDIMNVINSFDQ
jgi:hypothetical protein